MPLCIPGARLNRRSGGVARQTCFLQLAAHLCQALHPHVDHQRGAGRLRRGRNRPPVGRGAALCVAGNQRDATRHAAVGHRNANGSGRCDACRDAADHFNRDPGGFERQHFFAATAKYKRVAPFETGDDLAAARAADQQALDKCLRCRFAATALAHFDHPCAGPHMLQHRAIDQVIDQHHVSRAENACCFDGQ